MGIADSFERHIRRQGGHLPGSFDRFSHGKGGGVVRIGVVGGGVVRIGVVGGGVVRIGVVTGQPFCDGDDRVSALRGAPACGALPEML